MSATAHLSAFRSFKPQQVEDVCRPFRHFEKIDYQKKKYNKQASSAEWRPPVENP